MKHFDTFETCVNVLGISVAITDIYNILSIILLVVSIASMLIRCCYKIYMHIKNKNIDKVIEEVDKLKDDLKDLQDKTKGDHEDGK